MEPVYCEGDYLLVNRLGFLFRRPREGEIVVARVGLGGGGVLKRVAWVKDERVFLLGDNRGRSVDSRMYGSVPLKWVTGRVWKKIGKKAESI